MFHVQISTTRITDMYFPLNATYKIERRSNTEYIRPPLHSDFESYTTVGKHTSRKYTHKKVVTNNTRATWEV